jgi:hypothetical protein
MKKKYWILEPNELNYWSDNDIDRYTEKNIIKKKLKTKCYYKYADTYFLGV